MLSVLLPTDFSENSINAIKYALEFFKYNKTAFYFLHAYLNDVYSHPDLKSKEDFEKVSNDIKQDSQSHLKKLLAKVEQLSPNPRFTYHTISAYGTLVEETNAIANSKNIDLIVMGTQGKSNERNIVFGSQTFQVLKNVLCPVLTIPKGYNNTQPKQILFPTNFMVPYKRRELKLLSTLAKSYRSRIDVLYVSNSINLSLRQEDNKAFIAESLCENQVDFCYRKGKNIDVVIKGYIKEKNIDLVTMVNTRHSFLEDYFRPSHIDEVGINLKIPLLAMQNIERC